MTFVYDIYLNFQDVCYDFYEWNKKDSITHVRKIPIFSIEEETFKNILLHENKIDENSFVSIKRKAEFFKKKKKFSATLFTNGKDVIAVLFNNKGIIIKKSSLLLEEENMILTSNQKIDFLPIVLTEIEKKSPILSTRLELERKKFLLEKFSNIEEEQLIYLYFECFGKIEKNRKYIEKSLTKEILLGNEKICSLSYNFLKLIYTNS